MKNETLHTVSELKFAGDGGTFQGYASIFGNTDNANDVVMKGAFKKTLADAKRNGSNPPMLWQHDKYAPIGKWSSMIEDDKGLLVSGELFINDIAKAREAYSLMKANVITGLSIGYRTKQSGRDATTGARLLKEVDLLEVSIVTFPCNEAARINSVKNRPTTVREFEELLRDAGFSRTEAKAISCGFKHDLLRDAGGVQSEIEKLISTISN